VLHRFIKVGNNDLSEVNSAADAVPVIKRGSGGSGNVVSQSVSVGAPPQSHNRARTRTNVGSWRLGILSSVVSDNGQSSCGRPGTSDELQFCFVNFCRAFDHSDDLWLMK
jgi:hypothetical protein